MIVELVSNKEFPGGAGRRISDSVTRIFSRFLTILSSSGCKFHQKIQYRPSAHIVAFIKVFLLYLAPSGAWNRSYPLIEAFIKQTGPNTLCLMVLARFCSWQVDTRGWQKTSKL